jgi:hypothetical protein
MIKNIIEMLKLADHIGHGKAIEIAKGKHELKDTVKGILKQSIREFKVKRHGRKKSN